MVTINASPERSLQLGYAGEDKVTKVISEQNLNGDEARAFQVAKSEYFSRLSTMYASDTPTRAMSVVTLTRADGKQIMAERMGAFPDMIPSPEPEPEPTPEEPEA